MIFWKYHGLGNDFILFEDLEMQAPTDPEVVRRLCDRRTGIGGDGILYIRPDDEGDAFMKIMNSDGSEAEMCGNGIRCVAKHLYDFAIAPVERMRINTMGGMKEVTVTISEGEVTEASVDMGAPMLDCKDVPMDCEGRFVDGAIEVNGMSIRGTAVSMGNPHFVIFQELSDREVQELRPAVHAHPIFPRRTNVEFVRPRGERLDVIVYERGAGVDPGLRDGGPARPLWLPASKGSSPWAGTSPSAYRGGDLTINVKKDLAMVRMTGPAVRVFQGEMEL